MVRSLRGKCFWVAEWSGVRKPEGSGSTGFARNYEPCALGLPGRSSTKS